MIAFAALAVAAGVGLITWGWRRHRRADFPEWRTSGAAWETLTPTGFALNALGVSSLALGVYLLYTRTPW